jgi:glycine betaine/choline ABC-type transport system substrate-binding protein/predicted Ser/Thr protein kinase
MPGTEPLRAGDPGEIGGYELVGRLGEGGQGVVYLANARSGNVAVKLPHSRLAGDDPDAYHRFLSEITAVRRVAQFCTARILHVGIDDDYPYIVSEYVDGVSLQDAVETDGPLRGGALDRLAAGTMMALAATHAAGVIHQDFKPHNVLLGPDGPRVIDFGVARALETPGTMTSGPLGTPAYMAPEQLRRGDADEVGPAADMFSWALTMTFAATGRPAFGADAAVSDRILHAEPDVADLPSPLREMVVRCLAKDPRRRPRARDVLLRLLGYDDAVPSPGEAPDEVGFRTPKAPTLDRRHPAPPPGAVRPDPRRPRPGAPWWRSGRALAATGVTLAVIGALVAAPRFLPSAHPAGGGTPVPVAAKRPITVGSANFAGNQLLGEIYAQALEAKGYRVTRRPDIGSREVYFDQVTSGAVSVIPEYNGALATYLDKSSDATSAEELNAVLRRDLPPELEILDSADAEDKDSLTVTRQTATRYGLKSIGDLKGVAPNLVIGGPSEFETRHQGLVGLQVKYDLHFKEFQPFETSDQDTMVSLLKHDQIQVANLFTTNVAIATNKFVVLEDPENVFVAENVTPLVYRSALDDTARAQLNAVSAKLTTAGLLAMMKRLQVDGRPPDVVARDWLKQVGLVR